MFHIIKEAFEHSQFFENYKNVDNVLLQFKNITKKYKNAKKEFKKDLINFIHEFIKYNVKEEYLEKYILFLFEKYDPNEIISEMLDLKGNVYNTIHNINSIKIFLDDDLDEKFIYENCTPEYFLKNKHLDKRKLKNNDKMTKLLNQLDTYGNILNQKLEIGHSIKKYLKYSNDINETFIETVKSGYVKNVKHAYNYGADIHHDHNLALTLSFSSHKEDIFEFLIKKYNNINDNYIRYLLLSTYTDKNLKLIKLLIGNRSIDVELLNKSLIKYVNEGEIEIVKFLIEKGADVNYRENINEHNPLQLSIKQNHYQIVKYLVKNGAIINDENTNSLNNLMYTRNSKIIRFLIKNGAKINGF